MGKKRAPECTAHRDCFANCQGLCRCLKDNDFGGRDCPFYRTAEEIKERKKQFGGGAACGHQQI